MLPRRRRLPRAGFSPTILNTRVSAAHLSLTYKKTPTLAGMAVIVSKKTVRLSVARHLLKRRIHAILRPWSNSNLACVVYARAGADTLPFSLLKQELEGLLQRISPV
jgi:ribonuclease P protein component